MMDPSLEDELRREISEMEDALDDQSEEISTLKGELGALGDRLREVTDERDSLRGALDEIHSIAGRHHD